MAAINSFDQKVLIKKRDLNSILIKQDKLGYENYVVMYPHDDFAIYPSFELIRFDKMSCLIRLYSLRFGESYILDHPFDYADAIHLISRFGNECFEVAVKLLIKKYGEKPDYYWDDE